MHFNHDSIPVLFSDWGANFALSASLAAIEDSTGTSEALLSGGLHAFLVSVFCPSFTLSLLRDR